MELVTYPNPILFERCKEIPNSGSGQSPNERASLVVKMWKIIQEWDFNNGVGLAAPQVGLNTRMFIWCPNYDIQAIWNPTLSCVKGHIGSTEGCLSLPGIKVTIQRATSSILDGTGINNKPIKFIGDAVTTRIWEHEIDHLDGKLINDNMNHEDSVSNRDDLKKLLKEYRSSTK